MPKPSISIVTQVRLLPSSGSSNGTIMEDDISDNRACQWELGQGAVYEQCSDNHVIRNKCYCPSAYDSRLTCDSEDNLSPVVDAEHPACSVDGITYYQSCKARKCNEGAVLATSEGACQTLLGTAATAIACTKDNETTSYYECSCDTSVYSEVCRYPQVEPSGEKYCYAGKYDASSNPSPDKQYKTGMCKVGSFEKCYQDGDNTNGYQVIDTKSESECRQKLGDGAEARLCEDRNDPDIRRFNCYFNPGEYKWTDDNCPVRHILGGGSIVINGKRYYKECKCHSAYKYHRYNCAGLLNGGGCEQEVTSENNDGTIPAGVTSLKSLLTVNVPKTTIRFATENGMSALANPATANIRPANAKKTNCRKTGLTIITAVPAEPSRPASPSLTAAAENTTSAKPASVPGSTPSNARAISR